MQDGFSLHSWHISYCVKTLSWFIVIVYSSVFAFSFWNSEGKKIKLANELWVFVFSRHALIRTCITETWSQMNGQINKYRKVVFLRQPHTSVDGCSFFFSTCETGTGVPCIDGATLSCIFLCVIHRVRQEPSGPSAGLTQPQHLCQTAPTNNNSACGYKQGETHCSTIQTISNSKGVTVTPLLLFLPLPQF